MSKNRLGLLMYLVLCFQTAACWEPHPSVFSFFFRQEYVLSTIWFTYKAWNNHCWRDIQVILASMEKTPEALILLLRILELVKFEVQHLEICCSAGVGIGLMQENPESIKTEVRSLMMIMMILIIITSLPLQSYQWGKVFLYNCIAQKYLEYQMQFVEIHSPDVLLEGKILYPKCFFSFSWEAQW